MEGLLGVPLYVNEDTSEVRFKNGEHAIVKDGDDVFSAVFSDDSVQIQMNGEDVYDSELAELLQERAKTDDSVCVSCHENTDYGDSDRRFKFVVFSYPPDIRKPTEFDHNEECIGFTHVGNQYFQEDKDVYTKKLTFTSHLFDEGELSTGTLTMCFEAQKHAYEGFHDIRLTECALSTNYDTYMVKAEQSDDLYFEFTDVTS